MSATGLLLEATLKTSIVVLIALCAHSLLRRQSAAFRHWILASAIFCVALVPVLAPLLPSWHISIYTTPATAWIDRQTQSQDARTAAAETLRREPARDGAHTSADGAPPAGLWAVVTSMASQSIAVVWIAGVGISLLILCAGLGRLMSIASRARPVTAGPWFESAARIAHAYGLQRTVQLLQTDHPTLLVTWGAVRPKVMLPRAAQLWSADRIHVVLAHELAHIKRSDWAIHMTGELVRAVYWFNPLVWVACTRLRQESEHATDDAVLNQGVTGSDYAGHLLNLARALSESRRIWLPAPAIARPSSLERRVHAMLNDRKNRAPATRIARLMTFAVVSCLTIALAAAQGTFSSFSGTVFDETNSFVPNVALTLTNAQSRAKYEVLSDHTGHFEFIGLAPGDYQLETKIAGFANLRGTLTLAGQNLQRDLVLQIGSLEETIHVTGPGTAPRPARTSTSARAARRPDPTCSSVPAGGVGGNIRAPQKLVDVKPIYPQELSEANIGGTVVLQALIDTEGRVSSVDVVSPAHPDLNAAAIEAVRQWEFDSTILNCRKVEVPMKVNVTFSPR